MRKISLFIAMSLDGYIADENGGVDWLKGQGNDTENVDVYSEFIKDIDTVLMGRKTYEQIVTELSPAEWVYDGLTSYVFTHKEQSSSGNIRFVKEAPGELLRKLRAEEGKGIWICGGADLVRQVLAEDLIDQYYISVIPVLLGSGIRLFSGMDKKMELKLVKTQNYNGITDLVYERR